MEDRHGDPVEPVPLAVGDYIDTLSGGAGGESSSGQSKTYDGLIIDNPGNLGRILLETDSRFAASHNDADLDGYDEYWYTGYNPTAWDTWYATTNSQGLHPATNRIVILPIINPVGLTGSSDDVQILGFAAFFIERVWDGQTVEYNQQTGESTIPARGDLEGRFIQAITSGSVDDGWPFEGTKKVGPNSVRDVYLIS